MILAGTMVYDVLDPKTLDRIGELEANTSASLNATATEVEARGGWGNKLHETYQHSSVLEVVANTMKIEMEYLAMKIGSDISYGDDVYHQEGITITGNKGLITGDIVPFEGQWVAWVRPEGQTGLFKKVMVDKDTKEFVYPVEDGTKLCVKYFVESENARKIIVGTTYIPKTVYLVGRVQGLQDGEPSGTMLVKIPRFKLNAGFSLSFSADGISDFEFSGKSLAVEDTSCNGGKDYYATISYEEEDKKWQDACSKIYAAPYVLEMRVGEKETVEASTVYSDGSKNNMIKPSNLVFSIPSNATGIATVNSDGEVTAVGAGTTTMHVSVKEYPNLADDVNITVTD